MKYNKSIRLLGAVSALLISAQYGGSNRSVDSTLPELNVRGVITDSTNHSYNLENMTIAGRCQQIPMFHKPAHPEDNPEYNMTRIDLKDVDTITLDSKELSTFQKREYLTIIVTFKGSKKTKNTYIIPRTYMIRAQELIDNAQARLEREFSFIALNKLEINRVTTQQCRDLDTQAQSSPPCFIDSAKTRADRLVEELEKTSNQLSDQHNTLVKDIKKHLDYLINQLKITLSTSYKAS